jgi:hypothetical protein
MGPFRDYRRVIQAAGRCCGGTACGATRSRPLVLRELFQAIVERSWTPAETDTLRRAARSGLL